jgi:hypothetical protein
MESTTEVVVASFTDWVPWAAWVLSEIRVALVDAVEFQALPEAPPELAAVTVAALAMPSTVLSFEATSHPLGYGGRHDVWGWGFAVAPGRRTMDEGDRSDHRESGRSVRG